MKIKFKKVLVVFAMSAVTVFSAFAAGCDNSASDWIEDKIDQLKCKHVTTKIIERIEPTCTEEGKTEGLECVDCGKIVTKPDTIAAKGHVLIHYDEEKATCLENGTSEGEYCTVCETWVKERETIKATGHKIVAIEGKATTCTETGLTLGQKCENCGDVYVAQEVIPAKGHKFGADSCCTVCGERDFDAFLASGKYIPTSYTAGSQVRKNKVYRIMLDNYSTYVEGEVYYCNVGIDPLYFNSAQYNTTDLQNPHLLTVTKSKSGDGTYGYSVSKWGNSTFDGSMNIDGMSPTGDFDYRLAEDGSYIDIFIINDTIKFAQSMSPDIPVATMTFTFANSANVYVLMPSA